MFHIVFSNNIYLFISFTSTDQHTYFTRKNLQCPKGIANKDERYFNMEDAAKRCNDNPRCFALYDYQCKGREYYLCEDEKRWNELTSYSKESDFSCLQFKDKGIKHKIVISEISLIYCHPLGIL